MLTNNFRDWFQYSIILLMKFIQSIQRQNFKIENQAIYNNSKINNFYR